MNPVAAIGRVLLAITLLTIAGSFGPTPSAAAEPAPAPAPTQAQTSAGPVRLELTEMTPRVVTATGPNTLTINGTITNTGADPVDDLEVRVQRGDAIDDERTLDTTLDGAGRSDSVTPQFQPLAAELAPGARLPVHLSIPLRGPSDSTLALAETGVHELLVNVNGAPRAAARARLAAVRTLLPVLSLPPDPAAPDQVPEAATGGAAPFAMLLPITDAPRRLATVPGEPTQLADDELAAELAPSGRLGGVVGALARLAPPGSRLRDATCLAIDPALVETAARMRDPAGYQVVGPDGTPPVPGTGSAVAARWLDQLATAARGGCVIALPYADADLDALTRAGMGELATTAITDGRQVLQQILQVTVVPDVTWPADGRMDEGTLAAAARAAGRSVVLSADGVEHSGNARTRGVHPIAGGQRPQFTVLTDPLLTRATGEAAGGDDVGPPRGASTPTASSAGTTGPLATQDLIGALAFRTQDQLDAAALAAGPLVLAPPHQWSAGGPAVEALLGAVNQLLDVGRIVPRGLDAVLAAGPPSGAPALPISHVEPSGADLPGAVLDTLRATNADIDDLASAAVPDSRVGVSPEEVFTPLRRGRLRPVSVAWRGDPDAATAAAAELARRVSNLRGTIRVLEPPGPYSLGTSDAPILITVSNGLPVTMRVQVEILPSAGLRVAPIETQEVPPLGRRQVRVSTEVTRSGQFIVQAAVRTPNGELLGPPSRLRVRSTAYGTITVWLTASAGILLVVLAVRRIVRRIRAEPSGRTEGPDTRPTEVLYPGPLEATDRLPAVLPRRDGPPQPPGPPRVPSP